MIRNILYAITAVVVITAAIFALNTDAIMSRYYNPTPVAIPPNPLLSKPWEQEAEAWDWCTNIQSSFPERHITACTIVIQSGKETGKRLAVAYERRGNAYYYNLRYVPNWSQTDNAMADYNEAIRLDPELISAYIGRGWLYVGRDNDRAKTDFDQAIRLNPNKTDGFFARARLYADMGDYDRAIADCDQTIQIDPKHLPAFGLRAYAYIKKQDYDHAIAEYDQMIRLETDDPRSRFSIFLTFHNRGDIYFRMGDYDRAIADFDEAIRRVPENYPKDVAARSLYRRGLAKQKKGDVIGGSADIAAATALNVNVAEEFSKD